MPAFFISATGTGVGKTWLTRGLARALSRTGRSVAALKPIETGVLTRPLDAVAIARASGHPTDADLPNLYRATPPLAPYAITLQGDHEPLIMAPIVSMIETRAREVEWLLVEAAGGLLVPLTERESLAAFAQRLDYPLVLVSPDELGTLSHSLTAVESATERGLHLQAVVLTRCASDAPGSNLDILTRWLSPTPVVGFLETADDDEALADEVERCGILRLLED
ncbi:MAG: dethiobiotin synthase [Deltaproteobacteria bacterium]|nr:dethiobiotin synthase [Deltaproteobacteria bacterium]